MKTISAALFGAPLDPFSSQTRQHIALVAFLAWIGLGADGLSSSCYGPEEAFLALGEHTHLALYMAAATALTVFVIAVAYNQVIELFPSGGGGYKVATNLIGPYTGLVSGAALIVDYMLTIAISVASGADAVFSLLPVAAQSLKLWTELGLVLLLPLPQPARHARIDQGPAADLSRLLRHPCCARLVRRRDAVRELARADPGDAAGDR
jgi:hypothetical protein